MEFTYAKKRMLAKLLAEYFTDESTPSVRACACDGGPCPDCQRYWEMKLDGKNTRKMLRKAIDIIELADKNKGDY